MAVFVITTVSGGTYTTDKITLNFLNLGGKTNE